MAHGSSANDYPFTSWEKFSSAFSEFLASEFNMEYYPKYYEAIRDGDTTNVNIIKNLVQEYKENPQTILNDIIYTYCNTENHYTEQMRNGGNCEIIDYLLKEGAVLRPEMFFDWNMDDYEISMGCNVVRAALIDHYFPRFGFTADEYNDIEPFDEDDDIEYYDITIVKRDLKSKSKFLSNSKKYKKYCRK